MPHRGLASADRTAPLDEELRAALRQVPASVAIVTTGRGTAALGITATSVTPVSLAPPALLVCVNRALRLNGAMHTHGRFQISYLRRGQEEIACAFAGAVAGFERFRFGEWNLDASAGAELPSALIGVSCRLETSLDYGSHSVFIGRVEGVRRSAGDPLVYCGGGYTWRSVNMNLKRLLSAVALVCAFAAPAAGAQSPNVQDALKVAESCATRILPAGPPLSGRLSDVVLARRGAGRLALLGVEHSRDPGHPQFGELVGLFNNAQPSIVLHEGQDLSLSPGSSAIEATSEMGEVGLLLHLAAAARVPVHSFEPSTPALHAFLLESFDPEQVQLFFLLRTVHQASAILRLPWQTVRDHAENHIAAEFSSGETPWPIQTFAELERAFERTWPGMSLRDLPASWFSPGLSSSAPESKFLKAIATAQSDFRNQHIYKALAAFLLSGHRVFAVIGKSHIPRLAPALACLTESE